MANAVHGRSNSPHAEHGVTSEREYLPQWSRTGMPRRVASILCLCCCRRQGDRSERAALTETPTYCPDDRRRLDKYASAVVLVAVCILTGCTPVSLTDTHITGTPQPQSFNTDER